MPQQQQQQYSVATSRLINCYTPLPLPKDVEEEAATVVVAVDDPPSSSSSSLSVPLVRRDTGESETTESQFRGPEELRRVLWHENAIPTATGSVYMELGHSKVVAAVYAPVTASSSNSAKLPNSLLPLPPDQGILHCHVSYTPHVSQPLAQYHAARTPQALDTTTNSQTKKGATSTTTSTTTPTLNTVSSSTAWLVQRELSLGQQLQTALAAAVPLSEYPKSAIVVHVTILQDDGSILSACSTAASLALVHARVQLWDVVTACTVALVQNTTTTTTPNNNENNNNNKDNSKTESTTTMTSTTNVQWQVWADPTLAEEQSCTTHSVMTLALLPNRKEVTLWDWTPTPFGSSRSSSTKSPPTSLSNQALEVCRKGCRTIHQLMRQHLLQTSSSS